MHFNTFYWILHKNLRKNGKLLFNNSSDCLFFRLLKIKSIITKTIARIDLMIYNIVKIYVKMG